MRLTLTPFRLFCLILLSLFVISSFAESQPFQKRNKRFRNFNPQNRPVKNRNFGNKRTNQQVVFKESISQDTGSSKAPLLFTIGVHVEPFKRQYSKDGRPALNYETNEIVFKHHLSNTKELAKTVEKYGGKLVVQTQSPFTDVVLKNNDSVFKDLVSKGHEVGLHFHEDFHLKKNSENLPPNQWTAKMKEQMSLIQKASGKPVKYWSGGNLYPHLIKAASDAGLDVMSDYKNPRTQKSDESLISVNPWRPKDGPQENNNEAFATHDPNGKVVYLPPGIYPNEMGEGKRSVDEGDDTARYFDYLTKALRDSLKKTKYDRVNVFHVTIHPGELKARPNDYKSVVLLDKWLKEIVDPLVKQGKLKWATFSEMADQFKTWEKAHPGVDPRAYDKVVKSEKKKDLSQKANITFAINVHDIVNIDKSAQIIKRLVNLFSKYNVRGDFYFTAPMVRLYKKKHPDVIQLLKDKNMTISYHARPPHPINNNFDDRLKNLNDEELKKILRDYESYELDMSTGNLNKAKTGGYLYVKEVFGKPPVTVGSPNHDRRVKKEHLKILKDMGAKVVVLYHEKGTDPQNPFKYTQGLLQRPSDFSVTRWKDVGRDKPNFWCNMIRDGGSADDYPEYHFKNEFQKWDNTRSPFVTVLIHENNFYRRLGTPWTYIYYHDLHKKSPRTPPYDLRAKDASKPRTIENQKVIWDAYEAFVKYAAENQNVVTSEDVVEMAEK